MRLPRIGGIAIDARAVAADLASPRARARHAAWIAANLLAVSGVRVDADADLDEPSEPRLLRIGADRFEDLLVALAETPALIDPGSLRYSWWAYARALALPLLDRSIDDALAAGASVITLDPTRPALRAA